MHGELHDWIGCKCVLTQRPTTARQHRPRRFCLTFRSQDLAVEPQTLLLERRSPWRTMHFSSQFLYQDLNPTAANARCLLTKLYRLTSITMERMRSLLAYSRCASWISSSLKVALIGTEIFPSLSHSNSCFRFQVWREVLSTAGFRSNRRGLC